MSVTPWYTVQPVSYSLKQETRPMIAVGARTGFSKGTMKTIHPCADSVNPRLVPALLESFECDICGAPAPRSVAVLLPDLGGEFNQCCPACAHSERFFDTLEDAATSFFLRAIADVPDTLKPLILETLVFALEDAARLSPPRVKCQPRRVPFTAALHGNERFGALLRELNLMPDPNAPVSSDGLFLEFPVEGQVC
jgi:hypothetical protein